MAKRLPVVTQEIWEKKIPAGKYMAAGTSKLTITPGRNGPVMVSEATEGSKRIFRDEFTESQAAIEARRLALRADGFKVSIKQVKVRPEDAPRGMSEGEIVRMQHDEELREYLRRSR